MFPVCGKGKGEISVNLSAYEKHLETYCYFASLLGTISIIAQSRKQDNKWKHNLIQIVT